MSLLNTDQKREKRTWQMLTIARDYTRAKALLVHSDQTEPVEQNISMMT